MSNGHIWRTCVYYSICTRCHARAIASHGASGDRDAAVDSPCWRGEAVSRHAKRCRWRKVEVFGFDLCSGKRCCLLPGERHQTSREWKRACRRMDRWHAGRHDWAWLTTQVPF